MSSLSASSVTCESPPPMSAMQITVMPSMACNLRCKFCFQPYFDHRLSLSAEVMHEKLAAAYAGAERILVLGGEPTIIPGCRDFVEMLARDYPQAALEIVSNGVKLEGAWLDTVLAAGVQVAVSLNASHAEMYARTLQNSGGPRLWSKSFENVLTLIARRQVAGVTDPPLVLSFVVTPDTAEDLVPFVATVCALGVEAKVLFDCRGPQAQEHPAVIQAYDTALGLKSVCREHCAISVVNIPPAQRQAWEARSRTEESRRALDLLRVELNERVARLEPELRQRIDERASQLAPSDTHRVARRRPTPRRGEDLPYGAGRTQVAGVEVCRAPWHGLVVQHDANVYFCSRMHSHPLGNLEQQELADLWGGPRAQAVRQLMLAGDFRYCDPTCPANCHPASSLRWQTARHSADALFDKGDFAAAGPLYELAVGQEPDNAMLAYRLAFCWHSTGRSSEALKLYDQVLAQGFAEFWVRYNRGLLHRSMGNHASAEADLGRAAELDPNHVVAAIYRDYMAELKATA